MDGKAASKRKPWKALRDLATHQDQGVDPSDRHGGRNHLTLKEYVAKTTGLAEQTQVGDAVAATVDVDRRREKKAKENFESGMTDGKYVVNGDEDVVVGEN